MKSLLFNMIDYPLICEVKYYKCHTLRGDDVICGCVVSLTAALEIYEHTPIDATPSALQLRIDKDVYSLPTSMKSHLTIQCSDNFSQQLAY